jgi:hypothetical protein
VKFPGPARPSRRPARAASRRFSEVRQSRHARSCGVSEPVPDLSRTHRRKGAPPSGRWSASAPRGPIPQRESIDLDRLAYLRLRIQAFERQPGEAAVLETCHADRPDAERLLRLWHSNRPSPSGSEQEAIRRSHFPLRRAVIQRNFRTARHHPGH